MPASYVHADPHVKGIRSAWWVKNENTYVYHALLAQAEIADSRRTFGRRSAEGKLGLLLIVRTNFGTDHLKVPFEFYTYSE